ncbi:MAG: hypothetical protein ACTIL2_07710 [Corynebacterium sp.]|uniref:hypothetical protein n=1 Tax=Corynebacterium sp. TaxID=1720 RepID=UPI003F9ADAB1
MVARRPLFRDSKEYAVPDSLEQLHGPEDGMFDVPLSIHWARPGGSTVDLASRGGRSIAYSAALAEGTIEQVCSIINRDHLVADWPTIPKAIRIRRLWEERFPELAACGPAHNPLH